MPQLRPTAGRAAEATGSGTGGSQGAEEGERRGSIQPGGAERAAAVRGSSSGGHAETKRQKKRAGKKVEGAVGFEQAIKVEDDKGMVWMWHAGEGKGEEGRGGSISEKEGEAERKMLWVWDWEAAERRGVRVVARHGLRMAALGLYEEAEMEGCGGVSDVMLSTLEALAKSR